VIRFIDDDIDVLNGGVEQRGRGAAAQVEIESKV